MRAHRLKTPPTSTEKPMFPSWLQKQFRRRVNALSPSRARGRSVNRHRAVPLIVEELEGRLTPAGPGPLANINHFVVIYQENWSFDGLYGSFPGANGISNATDTAQVTKSGAPITYTPSPLTDDNGVDTHFPSVQVNG